MIGSHLRDNNDNSNKWSFKPELTNNFYMNESYESFNSYDTQEGSIIRKLGAAELVYEYEIPTKGLLLPFTLVFNSCVNLFEHKNKIEKAINKWKTSHPFLCAKIQTKQDLEHADFSRERYFVYASKDKIKSMDNVKYLILDNEMDWIKYHEIEMNSEPVDSKNGLLWRIAFLKLNTCQKYCIILTIHHAIIDGRNAPVLLQQLLYFIEKSIQNKRIEDRVYQVYPSIEETLFKNNRNEMKNVKFNPDYFIPHQNRIPKEFKNKKQTDNNESVDSKFKCFTIKNEKFRGLYKNSKLNKTKLTGCLNVVTALACLEMYKEFKCNQKQDNELYENAKLSNLLLDLFDENIQFQNGGSHFCISNVGRIDHAYKMQLFKTKEMFFSVSVKENRWSAVNFNGLCTIDDTLCWSLCYNSYCYDDDVIDFLIQKIIFIIDCICE
ncbi:unnamed protein product [Brachionus calyciflorus]|uniref:Condensation domain-containing protein n=1 Tax=Brachionus calyciflorus TaxID=104777 RepID=A0A814ATU1_9BILA|nr:unnamed protein product [Brachionus calyciflorus]